MPEITEQNQEKRQAAGLRQQRNQARNSKLAAKKQVATTTAGQSGVNRMMRADANLNNTGLGSTNSGTGAQRNRKAGKEPHKTAQKGSRIAKLKAGALQKKSEGKSESSKASSSLGKKGADRLLRAAWLNLLPSWGLSLFYINTHVFLSWIFPKQFSSLGQEWPMVMTGSQTGKKVVGLGESLLLAFLNLIIFFLLFAIIALIFWFINLNVFEIIGFVF